jgi:hypothetical protein
MKVRKVNWVFPAVMVTLVLILAAHKPLPQPKIRAQRIHAVNHWANITITFPSTNTLFVPASKK